MAAVANEVDTPLPGEKDTSTAATDNVGLAADGKPFTLTDEQPITWFRDDPDGAYQFYRFTRSRNWRGWKRVRDCATTTCEDGSKTTFTTAQAIEGSETIVPKDSVYFDRVVGRIVTTEKKTEKLYKHCRNYNNRSVECYIVVTVNKDEYLVELTIWKTGGSTNYGLKLGQPLKKFGWCVQDPTAPTPTMQEADFKECSRMDSSSVVGMMHRGHHHFGGPFSPFWMACNEGCCS